MKLIRIVIFAVAAVAAIGAAFMARGLLSNGPKQAVAQKPQVEVVDVLVAANRLELGTLISDKDLRWQQWPKKITSSQFIVRTTNGANRKKIAGSAVRSAIVAGEPINLAKLVSTKGGGYMAAILPKGMRAISVRISPVTGAGGFILPNDRVDVLLTRKEKNKDEGQSSQVYLSETILSNVKVLAIDQSLKEKKGPDGRQVAVGKTATLELEPSQAELLSLSVSKGEITLALRSIVDAGGANAAPMTALNLAKKKGRRRTNQITVLRYGISRTVDTSQ
jgi:pilus assembly protein CpaB